MSLRITKPSLPYIDNTKAISITLLLNLLLPWIFRLDRYEAGDIVVDAVICAVLTTVINVLVVWHFVRKARAAGIVSKEVPISKLMMRLPKNRLGLIAVFGTFFAVLCVGINYTVFTWYGFESWTFGQFLLYKLVYSLILSERIVSLCIFRLVQPDCGTSDDDHSATISQPIKNPLPSLSGMHGLFSNISANLALQLFFNPYVGTYAIGGDRSIIIEGIIGSVITCFIIVGLIAKTLDMARANGEFNVPPNHVLPNRVPLNRWLTLLPKNRWLFALLCSLIAAPIGVAIFVVLFQFYGFASWTFYEFFWIKMAYLTVLGKILVAVTVRRFTQPDIV
jgi:hypothetical protein